MSVAGGKRIRPPKFAKIMLILFSLPKPCKAGELKMKKPDARSAFKPTLFVKSFVPGSARTKLLRNHFKDHLRREESTSNNSLPPKASKIAISKKQTDKRRRFENPRGG
jgi:hypothetical protein